jgi:hypothetical protein
MVSGVGPRQRENACGRQIIDRTIRFRRVDLRVGMGKCKEVYSGGLSASCRGMSNPGSAFGNAIGTVRLRLKDIC